MRGIRVLLSCLLLTSFWIMGLMRTSLTDDEMTYIGFVNDSSSLQEVIAISLAFTTHIGGVITHYLLGDDGYLVFKLAVLILSYVWFDNLFMKNRSYYSILFIFFLLPYAYLAGTYLRDDLIVSLLLLLFSLSIRVQYKPISSKLAILVVLSALYFFRSYWAIIILILVLLHYLVKKVRFYYLYSILVVMLFLPFVRNPFVESNFNIVDYIFSPLPWKIGIANVDVGLYENVLAYWFLFLIKIFIFISLIQEIIYNRISIVKNPMIFSVFILFIVQNMTVLNGPRQTTILLGLIVASLRANRPSKTFNLEGNDIS